MDRTSIRSNVRLLTLVESTHVSDVELNTIIDQCMQEIAVASDWPFLYKTDDLSLVADTRTVALPADFQRAVALVDDDQDGATIPYLSPEVFYTRYGNDTGNESTAFRAWTIVGTNIVLSPVPTANDTDRLTLVYYREITALAADGSEPEFHAAFHWAVVEYTKAKVYEREEYYDEAERSWTMYLRYLDDMVAFYSRRHDVAPMIYGQGLRHKRGVPNLPWWNNF